MLILSLSGVWTKADWKPSKFYVSASYKLCLLQAAVKLFWNGTRYWIAVTLRVQYGSLNSTYVKMKLAFEKALTVYWSTGPHLNTYGINLQALELAVCFWFTHQVLYIDTDTLIILNMFFLLLDPQCFIPSFWVVVNITGADVRPQLCSMTTLHKRKAEQT